MGETISEPAGAATIRRSDDGRLLEALRHGCSYRWAVTFDEGTGRKDGFVGTVKEAEREMRRRAWDWEDQEVELIRDMGYPHVSAVDWRVTSGSVTGTVLLTSADCVIHELSAAEELDDQQPS